MSLPHALERVPVWSAGWRRSGRLLLLLDFDGTLAPIVARPELAAMPPATRAALDRLRALPGVETAVVSGRGLADVRERAGVPGIAYAGNHGMEIEGGGLHRLHAEAAAARPALEQAAAAIRPLADAVAGAFLEDKQLTLSLHYRLADGREVPALLESVRAAVSPLPDLHLTEGKMVLEVRPRVEWDKGRAVLFLLEQLAPPPGAPVLYFGDDRTDEDAFRALREGWEGGEGVLVAAEAPPGTLATSYLHDPGEVGAVFAALADAAEG
jgi:trehalose 6-phosphate phosphatase